MDKGELCRDMLSIIPDQLLQPKSPPRLNGIAKLTPQGLLLSPTSFYKRQSNTFEVPI